MLTEKEEEKEEGDIEGNIRHFSHTLQSQRPHKLNTQPLEEKNQPSVFSMSINFAFNTTKSILCELGSSARIGPVMKRLGCQPRQTLLLVTDKGIMDAKLADNCIKGLVQDGFNVEVYSDVVADPPEVKIAEALELSKSKNTVGIIGLGGGSSMDVAKVVAFLSHHDCNQNLADIYGVEQCMGNRLPLVQVPTTAGAE